MAHCHLDDEAIIYRSECFSAEETCFHLTSKLSMRAAVISVHWVIIINSIDFTADNAYWWAEESGCALPCVTSRVFTLLVNTPLHTYPTSVLSKNQDNITLDFRHGFCCSIAQTLSGPVLRRGISEITLGLTLGFSPTKDHFLLLGFIVAVTYAERLTCSCSR